MKQYTLQNEKLNILVEQQGAELTGIRSVESGLAYLWEADPTYWGRSSSILYPIVGRVYEDQYTFEGQSYPMKQHGIARNLPFELVYASPEFLELELRSHEETLSQYPFPFIFRVKYQLTQRKLSITYQIENPGENTAFFSVGAHPAFRCPLLPHEKRSDYRLVFDKKEQASTQMLAGGYRTGEKTKVLDNSAELPIRDDLFDQDALIFESLNSTQVSLENKAGKRFWTFDFEGFPYLGIWSKNDQSPFVCIEPWFGVADISGGYPDLKEKEGILSLAAGKTFQCSHRIEIF